MKTKTSPKRVMGMLLVLMMVLTLLPTVALATDGTGIYVGGTEVEADVYYKNAAEGGGITTEGASENDYNVYYDSTDGVLTLNGAEITANYVIAVNQNYAAIYTTVPLKINLLGENTLTGASSTTEDAGSYGIYAADALTISGDGSLEVIGGAQKGAGGYSYGVYCFQSVTISGGSVTATGGATTSRSYGVFGNTGVTISGGIVNATGGATTDNGSYSYGLLSNKNVTISGGIVNATGGAATDSSYGVYGFLSAPISGGIVNATGGVAVTSYGVHGGNSVPISGGVVETKGETGALSRAPALTSYPAPYIVTASTNADGSSPVVYDSANLSDYKYFRISPSIYVGGVDVSVGGYWLNNTTTGGITANDASADHYNVCYDTDNNILTLNGAEITENHTWDENFTAAVYSAGSLEINLLGVNTLTGAHDATDNAKSIGIFAADALSISGSGSVTAKGGTATNSYGVVGINSVTISGGTLEAIGGNATAFSNGIISNAVAISGGSVTATGNTATSSYGVYGDTSVTISGGVVTAAGNKAALYKLTIDDSYPDPHTVTVSTNADGSSPEDEYISTNLSTYKYFHIMPSELVLTDNDTEDPALLGTDYTYAPDGVLTIIKPGDYTLSMADGVEATTHRVSVTYAETDQTKLTLDNVHISGEYMSEGLYSGVLTFNEDVILTLSGENSLTNNFVPSKSGDKAYGVAFGAYCSLEITGDGSLDINVPYGDGIFLYRSRELNITGGSINITARRGTGLDYGSDDDESTKRYTQSGGEVEITVSVDSVAINVEEFLLSGGSLNIDGDAMTGIHADKSFSVTGGSLTIDCGKCIMGIAASSGTNEDGKISFTGGVTDIQVSAGGMAVCNLYTADTASGEIPDHPFITVGDDVSVTKGGKLEWSARITTSDTWSTVNTFSESGEVSFTKEGYALGTFPGASSHVRIEPTYALTVELNGGDGGTTGGNYAKDAPIEINAGTKKGYTFSGWTSSNDGTFADADSASTTFIMPDNDTTITANWTYTGGSTGPSTPSTYTLTFNTNGGSAISGISKTSGTTVDLTTYKPTKTDYDFDGWYSDSGLTTKVTSVKLTANTTVYAKWTAKTVTPEMPFVDVPEDAYYKDAVLWAVDEGITEGTGDGTTFSPNDSCTRAQMATFLWRAAGSPEPTATVNPFADVTTDAYYYKAVLWAVEKGITLGTNDDGTTFSPSDTCTRGQMATFLYRYGGSPSVTGSNPFTDVTASDYYNDAVKWAADEGVTQGTNEAGTTFSPKEDCTRAQIVTFLYRDMK